MGAVFIGVCVVAALAISVFAMRGKREIKKECASGESKIDAQFYSKVYVPEEKFAGVEFNLEGKPLVGILNPEALKLEPKIAFRWFLSILISYKDTVGEDMPNSVDVLRIQSFGEQLDKNIKDDKRHPNAVFVGRITGNGQTQMMWYVNNPELANHYLQNLISSEKYPFEFIFEMYADDDWKEGHYWLDPLYE